MNTSKVNSQNKWYAFVGIALLSFGCYLDYTVVNVAIPTIQRDLQADLVSMQWVMNIYFLALCVSATMMGRFGDLYGRRRCLYIGGGIFLIASVIAGFSSNISWLILGRLLQGFGAAIIFPLGLSLLPQLFPVGERSKAVALFGSIGGIALALGPLLGGLIVTYWGWRWIFFLNIPICFLGYLFCYKSVEESPITKNVSLDIKGMLLLAFSLCGLVLGLIYTQSFGWVSPVTLSCFVLTIISSIILVKIEKDHPNPLIAFKDYSNVLFLSGAILSFLSGILSAVTLFFDPLYLQVIKNASAQLSGFILFAIPLSVFLMAFFVEKLIRNFGVLHTILIGLSLASIAALLQVFFTGNSSLSYIVFAFILLGSAWAMGNTVSIIAVQAAVGPERASVATGSLVTLFNLGGSIGLTIAIVIYNLITANSLAIASRSQIEAINTTQIALLKESIANPAHSLKFAYSDVIHNVFNKIFLEGFMSIMVFLLLCSLLALFIVLKCKIFESKITIQGSLNKTEEGI